MDEPILKESKLCIQVHMLYKHAAKGEKGKTSRYVLFYTVRVKQCDQFSLLINQCCAVLLYNVEHKARKEEVSHCSLCQRTVGQKRLKWGRGFVSGLNKKPVKNRPLRTREVKTKHLLWMTFCSPFCVLDEISQLSHAVTCSFTHILTKTLISDGSAASTTRLFVFSLALSDSDWAAKRPNDQNKFIRSQIMQAFDQSVN